MPISIWCILAAALLPWLSIAPAKFTKGYDNANPRDPAFWRDGFRARAQAAQYNGFEAFPFFAIAVIVALGQNASALWVDKLAILFIGLRIIYIFCYWMDRPTPRTLAWTCAVVVNVALFASPVWS